MKVSNPFEGKKVLVVHHWPYAGQRKPFFSEDVIYISLHGENQQGVINFPPGSRVDMELIINELKRKNWEPDLFIAKVDAFQNIIPVNVAAVKCPKVLVLGDTQHGENPLLTMINYATSEAYDLYISDHKRHHLWFYYLAGIRMSYWLPGLFLNPPHGNIQSLHIQGIDPQLFDNQPVFVGQYGDFHPRRKRLIEHLKKSVPNFFTTTVPQQASLKIFSQASVSLNISLNGDLNLRFLEIMSAGGMQIADRLSGESGARLLFKENEEIVYFDTREELVDKVKFYHQNKKENLQIRQRGHRRYMNELNPHVMTNHLYDLLQGKNIESRFTSSSIERMRDIDWQSITLERIVIYQLVQELHRVREEVFVLMDASVEYAAPEDFLDLPRLKVIVYDPAMDVQVRLQEYMDAAYDAKRLLMVKDYQEVTSADIILENQRDTFPRDILKTDDDLVIFASLQDNQNKLKIGYCKKNDQ